MHSYSPHDAFLIARVRLKIATVTHHISCPTVVDPLAKDFTCIVVSVYCYHYFHYVKGNKV